jgi:hypothetical protein
MTETDRGKRPTNVRPNNAYIHVYQVSITLCLTQTSEGVVANKKCGVEGEERKGTETKTRGEGC